MPRRPSHPIGAGAPTPSIPGHGAKRNRGGLGVRRVAADLSASPQEIVLLHSCERGHCHEVGSCDRRDDDLGGRPDRGPDPGVVGESYDDRLAEGFRPGGGWHVGARTAAPQRLPGRDGHEFRHDCGKLSCGFGRQPRRGHRLSLATRRVNRLHDDVYWGILNRLIGVLGDADRDGRVEPETQTGLDFSARPGAAPPPRVRVTPP